MVEAFMLLLTEPATYPRTEEFVSKYVVNQKFSTHVECQVYINETMYSKTERGGVWGMFIEVEGKEKQVFLHTCKNIK
jgi:hypothetical protein